MKQFPLFKLCIIYSFFGGLAAYRVIGRKMLQAFVNMIHFAFKRFSVMHQTVAMEENDRRREADRQVFYKCLT